MMNRQKKIGIILIIIGVSISLIVLPFLSGYSEEKGFFDNFYNISIRIKKDKSEPVQHNDKNTADEKTKPFEFSDLIPGKIPFRFFLALTVILLYIGIIWIDKSRKNTDGQAEKQ